MSLLSPLPQVRNFDAAVAAAAACIPAVSRATAQRHGRRYSVRYVLNNQPAIELEATSTVTAAVARFVQEAMADALRSPSLLSAPQRPSTDEYLAPLPDSVSELLLTAAERNTCRVFPLAGWRTDNADNQQPRWAVCQPCPRERWHSLERDDLLVYTELYTFPESWDKDESGATALVTHVGRLLVHDTQRGLFYATVWENGEGDISGCLAADDVQEVWRVVRLVAIP